MQRLVSESYPSSWEGDNSVSFSFSFLTVELKGENAQVQDAFSVLLLFPLEALSNCQEVAKGPAGRVEWQRMGLLAPCEVCRPHANSSLGCCRCRLLPVSGAVELKRRGHRAPHACGTPRSGVQVAEGSLSALGAWLSNSE